MTGDLEAAYSICRGIARAQARNFYYAFVALPKAKRNAICAVYAFMRHADDLADDESRSHPDRRDALNAWLDGWHRALAGIPTHDPVLLALLDARARFEIPPELLDQLVQGTAADLEPESTHPDGHLSSSARFATYPTFADLYHYCYMVASVVGLVCIRIFGYSDSRAEKLAEETGIAFQLTNVLRDVREDALRHRLYLPLEDLERCDVSPTEMMEISHRRQMTENQRRVLEIQARRAREFYKSAQALLPLISRDSRPALWVLVTIYSRLLRHIEQRNFDVFSAKISVPAYEKLTILGGGIFQTLLNLLRT